MRDWGVTPTAVIGHSSGEIGAAYASGALSLQEAIICAYMRGRVTKQQTKGGAMAVVGLGAADIQPYLVDGVAIACNNSPLNTTISGDGIKLGMVLQLIQNNNPGIMAKQLRVNIAYHSSG